MIAKSFFNNPRAELCSQRDALITMGGADPKNITELAINGLKMVGLKDVSVAIGSANMRHDAICALVPSTWRILEQGQFDFAAELAIHRIALINGGVTRYECAAIGTPFAAISLHEYQASITNRLVQDGFGFHLGIYNAISAELIGAEIAKILSSPKEHLVNMSKSGPSLVPLSGAENIVSAIEENMEVSR